MCDERLPTCEKKKINKVLGVIKVTEKWKKRYNKELMQLFGDLDILPFSNESTN
jgi:hypothetical protein